MGLLSKIGRGLKKIGGSLLKKGLGMLKGKLPGLIKGLLAKTPWGAVLSKGLDFLKKIGAGGATAGGPAGVIGALFGASPKLAKTVDDIVGALGGPDALRQAGGLNNVAQMAAQAQARQI
jgi:hypothetical protein